MPKRIKTWDYPCGCMLRKVKASGYITFMNQGYFLSEAFAEKEIGVQESDESNTYDLLYRGFRIGKLNAEERIITSRRVYR